MFCVHQIAREMSADKLILTIILGSRLTNARPCPERAPWRSRRVSAAHAYYKPPGALGRPAIRFRRASVLLFRRYLWQLGKRGFQHRLVVILIDERAGEIV